MRIDRSYIYTTILGCLSSKAPFGFSDSPSHNQCISFRITFCISSGVSGQWKELRSSFFIRIQNPNPSHCRILIDVRLRLQNANIQREYGSSWNFSLIMAASPQKAALQTLVPAPTVTSHNPFWIFGSSKSLWKGKSGAPNTRLYNSTHLIGIPESCQTRVCIFRLCS